MCPDCTQEHKEANYEMDYNIQKYDDLSRTQSSKLQDIIKGWYYDTNVDWMVRYR